MPNLILTVEDARDIIQGDHESAVVLETNIVDKTRWCIIKETIFSLNDHFYSVSYSEGATEYQEIDLFDGESSVECYEVHQVEKLVKVWEPVP